VQNIQINSKKMVKNIMVLFKRAVESRFLNIVKSFS